MPGDRQADTRGADAEDAIKDKAGWVTGGLRIKAGGGLKPAGQNTRVFQTGQGGSATGDQAGKQCEVLQYNKQRSGKDCWGRSI